ncbi:MAG: tetratricopeptide repeat protein [Anaerolineae bacterium]|nr:tetratricopeptide repeat protein [Anaerolineae bacterium]
MSAKQPVVRPNNALLTTEEAIEKYGNAVKSEPTAANYLELGAAYYIARRWDDALKAFEKTVEADPKQAFAYYYLGILNAAMGHRDKANKALDKLLEVSNNQMLKDQAQARIPQVSSPGDLGS